MTDDRMMSCPRSHTGLAIALALLAQLALGCSGGSSTNTDGGTLPAFDAGPTGCTVQFSGNYADSQSPDGGCAALVAIDGGDGDGGADWQLQLQAFSGVAQAETTVKIDLGGQPSPGTFNADTLQTWSAVSVTPAMCEFSAGDTSTPTGTFTLTINSVAGLSGSGAEATVHGVLEVEQYVQQPPGSNCGPDSTETVAFEF